MKIITIVAALEDCKLLLKRLAPVEATRVPVATARSGSIFVFSMVSFMNPLSSSSATCVVCGRLRLHLNLTMYHASPNLLSKRVWREILHLLSRKKFFLCVISLAAPLIINKHIMFSKKLLKHFTTHTAIFKICIFI